MTDLWEDWTDVVGSDTVAGTVRVAATWLRESVPAGRTVVSTPVASTVVGGQWQVTDVQPGAATVEARLDGLLPIRVQVQVPDTGRHRLRDLAPALPVQETVGLVTEARYLELAALVDDLTMRLAAVESGGGTAPTPSAHPSPDTYPSSTLYPIGA